MFTIRLKERIFEPVVVVEMAVVVQVMVTLVIIVTLGVVLVLMVLFVVVELVLVLLFCIGGDGCSSGCGSAGSNDKYGGLLAANESTTHQTPRR